MRRSTAICRPSMRSSTPAHRCASGTSTGGPFCGRRGLVRSGWASANAGAAVARRDTPLHVATNFCHAAAATAATATATAAAAADAMAALLGTDADAYASLQDEMPYAAPRRATQPTAAAAACREIANLKQSFEANGKSAEDMYAVLAAALEQARGRSARHRLPSTRCAAAAPRSDRTVGRALELAPARPSEHDAADLHRLSASP